MAKLADAQVSGSCGRPYGFESLHPHQRHPERGAFFVGADEGLTRFHRFARATAVATLSEGPLLGVSEIPFITVKCEHPFCGVLFSLVRMKD